MNFNKETNSYSKYLVNVLAAVFILSIGFFIGSTFFPQKSSTLATNSVVSNFNKLNTVSQTIFSKFYYKDRLTSSKVEDNSIKGFLSGLEDTPTRYLNTQEYTQYTDVLAGNIFGIGIEIGVNSDGSKINSVYPGTPAEKAGLQKDDIIIEVDSKDTSKSNPSDIATLIRGAIGTKVTVVVLRGDEKISKEITRDKITTSSVTFKNLNKDSVCSIEISRFTDDTVDTWKSNWDKSVDSFVSGGCKKAIIDLRGNGGGYVEAAKYALGEFVNDGVVIYGQKQTDGTIQNVVASRDTVTSSTVSSVSQKKGRLRDTPVVILVNAGSASASEIFAGSLQSLNRAKLVGTNSYGKGSVQATETYTDGSALIYTMANWTLPNGQVIDQNFPIKPDVNLSKDKDKDNQLDKAVDVLK